MLKPFKHQEKFAKDYKGKKLLVHEAGTGKTICAILWLKDNRDIKALVVCPKRVVDKWKKTLKDWNAKADVLSKEDFKKTELKNYKTLVIDECDWFASPLFVKGRSQLTEKMYEFIKDNEPEVLLLSATPIRSNPWNLHTLLTLSGHYIEWKKWQEYFFELKKLPYLPRPAYIVKKNWRQLIRPILEKHSDIILMKDCVDFLPPETHEIVKVKSDKFVNTEWEGSKAFYEEHKHEQKHKAEVILDISRQYRKVLVVAYYTDQIDILQKKLSKDRETFVLKGGVKNQEEVIKNAYNSDECFFIVQNSVGEGFDLDNFSAVIFASQSYAVRDYVQMKARVRRIHNLQPAIYYYLQAGKCDIAVYNNVIAGKDFVPSEYGK
jgi:superfamily II DNA or RNA helicase